mmetsp:Transcript_21509/g.60148  ORF Transcript_21509/g.60148 Transcript_21509/m.60148 type:complete len:217 (-) Transcript_21509:1936-2586(-)
MTMSSASTLPMGSSLVWQHSVPSPCSSLRSCVALTVNTDQPDWMLRQPTWLRRVVVIAWAAVGSLCGVGAKLPGTLMDSVSLWTTPLKSTFMKVGGAKAGASRTGTAKSRTRWRRSLSGAIPHRDVIRPLLDAFSCAAALHGTRRPPIARLDAMLDVDEVLSGIRVPFPALRAARARGPRVFHRHSYAVLLPSVLYRWLPGAAALRVWTRLWLPPA